MGCGVWGVGAGGPNGSKKRWGPSAATGAMAASNLLMRVERLGRLVLNWQNGPDAVTISGAPSYMIHDPPAKSHFGGY